MQRKNDVHNVHQKTLDNVHHMRYDKHMEVMPMPMTADEIIKLLEQNGFRFVSSNGSHRKYQHMATGRIVIVPYHKRELKKGTEQAILKQAGLK